MDEWEKAQLDHVSFVSLTRVSWIPNPSSASMAYFHTAASKHGRAALNLHGGNIAESSRKNSPSRGAEAENDKVVYDNTIVHKIKAISNDGLQPTDEHEIYLSDQGVIPSDAHVALSARCSPELPACELDLHLYIYGGKSGPNWGSSPHNATSTFTPVYKGRVSRTQSLLMFTDS